MFGCKPANPRVGSGPRLFPTSIENDPDPSFLTPDDMTGPYQAVRWDDQVEPVGDEKRGHHLEGGAGIGNVANGTVDGAAAEADRAGFENAAARCVSVFLFHRSIYIR